MFYLRPLRSWLGAKPIIVPPERRLPAETDGTLSASLYTLVPGGRGWITLEEARRLFSPLPDTRYAFGEMDESGRSRLSSFAAQNHCALNQCPDGGSYFTRLPDAEILLKGNEG
jgi:hypothetical protein